MTADGESEKWQRFEPDETWRQLRMVAERLGRRITGRIEDAEDVAQRTLAAYGLAKGVIENPEAWVTQVAVNASLTVLRTRQRVTPTDPSKLNECRHDPSCDKPDEIDQLLGAMVLERILRRLAPQQRAALMLKHGAGLERATVAEILRVKDETAKTHLKRGTQHLRALVDSQEEQETPIEGPARPERSRGVEKGRESR